MSGFTSRFVIAVLLASLALPAQPNRDSMLVSTEWLAAHLNDKNLVILHVGAPQDYEAGHIPGSVRLSLADISISGPDGLRLELPPEESMQTALGRAGITQESRIIIYPANESVQSATRVWFTLDYAGLGKQASLLDGGLPRWKAEGRPLSSETPNVAPTRPKISPQPALVASTDWIRDHLKDSSLLLIDARTPEFYTGANPGMATRAGHIPGAVSVPFSTLLDAQLKLRDSKELRAAIAPGKDVVVYCHIGQQATVLYFAAKMLGEKVRLYDGSFQAWAQRTELPVAQGERPQ